MKGQPSSKTATDTLAKKSKSEDVISGGHLVAKALKNEGVIPSSHSAEDTLSISTTDVSTRGYALLTYGMNRRPHMLPMAMPGRQVSSVAL